MVRVIMHGCNGVMGQVITGMAKDMEGLTIVAGIDLKNDKENGYPVYTSLEECKEEADVVVDFASQRQPITLWISVQKRSWAWYFALPDFLKSRSKSKRNGRENSSSPLCQYVFRRQSFIKTGSGCSQSAGWFRL